MRPLRPFVVIIACLGVFDVSAGNVADLFSARVPVADRSDTEFKRGVARALEVVIVKLTGNSLAAQSQAARAVVGRANRLVQQFGYERPADGDAQSSLRLRVEFDPRVLTREMRERGLVVWGKERPDTLVWIVIDDAGGQRVLGAQDEHAALRTIRARSDTRGIPVIFPLADIGEIAGAANAATYAEMDDVLRASAQKYGAESVLIGRLSEVGPGLVESRWSLSVGEETAVWEQQGDLMELLVEEATDNLADALGRRFAAPSAVAGSDAVSIRVRDLRSARDYARTERYLRSLDSVTAVQVRRVDREGILFDLNVHGGLVALSQSISFGDTLSADSAQPGVYYLSR